MVNRISLKAWLSNCESEEEQAAALAVLGIAVGFFEDPDFHARDLDFLIHEGFFYWHRHVRPFRRFPRLIPWGAPLRPHEWHERMAIRAARDWARAWRNFSEIWFRADKRKYPQLVLDGPTLSGLAEAFGADGREKILVLLHHPSLGLGPLLIASEAARKDRPRPPEPGTFMTRMKDSGPAYSLRRAMATDEGDSAPSIPAPSDELPPQGTPRWLNAEVRRQGQRQSHFRENVGLMLGVWIGLSPPQGEKTQLAFPDHKLPPGQNNLRIILTEPRHLREPLENTLSLPERGASNPVSFALPKLSAENGRFEGRLLVCHGNRILQTAKLTGAVLPAGAPEKPGDAIRLDIEAVLDPHLEDLKRPGFAASFVVNHSLDGGSHVTGIGSNTARIRAVDETLKSFVAELQNRLDAEIGQVFAALDKTPGDLWYWLAHQGRLLYQFLAWDQLGDLAGAERFQVISAHADAYLPLEFVYDGEPPDEGSEHLCPQAETSLRGGCSDCSPEKLRKGVCPARFWGMTKVIERHVWKSDAEVPTEFEVAARDPVGRPILGAIDSVLLGASDKVTEVKAGKQALKDLVSILPKVGPRAWKNVATWEEWRQEVARNNPRVLVLLTHTGDSRSAGAAGLEIGRGDRVLITKIDKDLVSLTKSRPVVLLLGCQTSTDLRMGQKFHAQFRRLKAPIVMGTLSLVYGPHAAEAAREILEALVAPDRPTTLGEIIRGIRRSLLFKGQLLALGLVAYGDADWVMGGSQ